MRLGGGRRRLGQLLGLLLATLGPNLAAHGQGWQAAPALPTDMSETLATISKDSKLYQIYQLYRENRDGLQRAAERISLAEAIRRGLASNPTLAERVAEIDASQWNGVAIGREWVPTFSIRTSDPGVLGYRTGTTSSVSKRDAREPSETVFFNRGFSSSPYANLSWSFFDPTRPVRLSALSSVTNSLRNRLTFTTRDLILAIQLAYTDLQEALDREKDYIELFNQAVHVYISAFNARKPVGEVSRLEAQAVAFLIDRVNAHKLSIQQADELASLINLEPGRLALPSERAEVIADWPLSRVASIERALKQREELQANAWDVKALRSDALAIRLRAWPALALSGQVKSVGGNNISGSLNGSPSVALSRSSGYESFAGLTFDWKLFDGGIRYAEASSRDAKARQTLARNQNIRLDITQEVADAYASFVASKILVDAARADVNASRLSLEGALRDYGAGRHDDAGTTVVQALSKLQSALDRYRNLVGGQNRSIYRLYRFTASWPEQTEQLVKIQYQRWLPNVVLPLQGEVRP